MGVAARIVLLFGLLWTSSLYAEGNLAQLSVPFECPQTSKSTIPGNAHLVVEIDITSGEVRSPEFEKLVADAGKTPEFDYYHCLKSFVERATSEISYWCDDDDQGKPDLCHTKKIMDEKLAPIFDKVAGYGVKAFETGAISPFEPGSGREPALNDDELGSMVNTVRKLCWFNQAAFLDETFLSEHLPAAVQELSCERKELANNYLSALKSSAMTPAQCTRTPERCAARRASIQRTLELLRNAGLAAELGEQGGRDPVDQVCKTGDELEQWLLEMALRTENLVACVEQSENDPDGVLVGVTSPDGTSTKSGTGLYPKYKITRNRDVPLSEHYRRMDGSLVPAGTKVPSFEAAVKFEFYPEVPAPDVSTAAIQANYSKLARDCFSSEPAKSKLRGPNGELLTLKVVDYDPATVDPEVVDPNGPPVHRVAVSTERSLRWTKVFWGEGISCEDILHETLHVLGLVDEYLEISDGALVTDEHVKFVDNLGERREGKRFPKNDCRVLGPEDSVMRDPASAFEAVKVSKYTVTVCACYDYRIGRPLGKKCLQAMATLNKPGAKACPAGTHSNPMPYSAADVRLHKAGQFLSPAKDRFLLSIEPVIQRSSLLYPAEFRAITEPGCVDKNKTYLLCAREAYKTSRGNYGDDSCGIGLPEACRDKKESAEWLR